MIQLTLEFQLEKPELPVEYERVVVSFLKAASSNYSKEMFERLYDKSKSIIKTFTYSVYLPGAFFDKNVIRLGEKRFKIFFSDADMGQTIEWFNSFQLMRMKKYPLNNNSMQLISVKSQNRKDIVDSELVIKMQSPLIVRQHNSDTNRDEYYTYDSKEFADKVKENVSVFLQRVNIDVSMDGFSLLPVKGKKVVVNCFGRDRC